MSTIRQRTQEDVIEYIKAHASDGKLQESLMDIANSLGYSNATIHRVLRSLEEQGIINVLPPDKPTKPNTIIYHGPVYETDSFMRRGVDLMNEVQRLSSQVAEYVREGQKILQSFQEQQRETVTDFESRVTEVVDMPDGKHQMMIVRKPEHAPHAL